MAHSLQTDIPVGGRLSEEGGTNQTVAKGPVRNMARVSKTLVIHRSANDLTVFMRALFYQSHFRIIDDSGWAFHVKEDTGILGRLFRNPSEFAVFLRESQEDPENETIVDLHAHMFGIGPIPKITLRKRIKVLVDYVEHVATQPLPEGKEDED